MTLGYWMGLFALVSLLVPPCSGEADPAPAPLTAAEVRERWHARLDGRHFTARVRLDMNLGGLRESRKLAVWRHDSNGSDERVLIRFQAPPDLRNIGLLYFERPDAPNDYFMYQPSTRRVRRVPEAVAYEDVYGIDLEFLGFGVAQSEPTRISGMDVESLRGRATYRLEEIALRANPRFERRTTWIDPQTFIPLRTLHILNGKSALDAQVVRLETIQGVATPTRMSFRREDTDRSVALTVEAVDYESAIPAEYFSVLALTRAR